MTRIVCGVFCLPRGWSDGETVRERLALCWLQEGAFTPERKHFESRLGPSCNTPAGAWQQDLFHRALRTEAVYSSTSSRAKCSSRSLEPSDGFAKPSFCTSSMSAELERLARPAWLQTLRRDWTNPARSLPRAGGVARQGLLYYQ